jgi:hypothetical protein
MPSSKPSDPGRAEIEGRIQERIRGFDVTALLLLLEEIGYTPDAIRRAGFPSTSPQPTWLEAIDFQAHPEGGSATIHGNLGLLSCRSPLPAYFRRFVEDPDVSEPLAELLGVLDDRLLERRFSSYAPERDRGLFPAASPSPKPDPNGPGAPDAWTSAKRDLLTLTALRSPSALHWLFQKAYPELRVTVRRAPQDRWIDTADVRLGSAVLGTAALGGLARLPVRGLEVTLLCRHRSSAILGERGPRPWAEVARDRLFELIFPVLRETGVELSVTLLILDGEAEAHLDEDRESLLSYVGYDPIQQRRKRIRFRRRLFTDGRRLARRRERRLRAFRQLLRSRIVRPRVPGPSPRVLLFSGPIPPAAT